MDVVEFDLQEDDAVAFGIVNLRVSPAYPKMLKVIIGLGCGLIVLLWALLLLVSRESWVGWFLLILGLPTMLLLVPKLIWRKLPGALRRHIRTGKNRAFLGPQRMELQSEGVRRIHSQSESKVNWSSVEKLVSSKSYLGIYIAANQAFVVPKRAFKSPTDETAFRAQAEQLAGQKIC